MRKLLLVSLIVCAIAGSAAGQAFVQGKGSTELMGASESLAFTSNNTAGNMIVVLWRDLNCGSTTSTPAASDSQSNTYIQQVWGYAQINFSSCNEQWFIFYAPNIKVGANTVTLTTSGSSTKEFYIGEYSGLSTTKPLEVSFASINQSTSPLAMAAYAQRTGVLVSCAFSRGGSANAPSAQSASGWSAARYVRNAGDGGMAVWDQVASASTAYTNNVTDSGGSPGQFNGLLILFRSAVPTTGYIQSVTKSVSSSTTAAATLPFTVTSGDLLVATTTNRGSISPTSVADGANTWHLVFTGPSNDVSVWYAMNIASGPTTVTATYGTSQEINLTVEEYAGLSTTYAVEVYQSSGRGGSPSSATAITIGTSDVVVSVVSDENHAADYFLPSSTYAQRAMTGANSFSSSAVFDATGGPGTFTNSVAVSPGSTNLTQAIIAFRSVLLTLDQRQFTSNTCTSATSCAITYQFSNTSGDMSLIVAEGDTFSDSTSVTISDSNSNTYSISPIRRDSGGLSPVEYTFYALNIGSGANTVTVTQGGSATTMRLLAMEVAGISAVDAFAGASLDSPTGGSGSGSSGYVISPGTAFLFSYSMLFGGSGSIGSPTSGLIAYPGTPDGKLIPYIEIGSSATYINTPALSGTPQFDIGLSVFTTSQNSQPRVTQAFTGNADAGVHAVTMTNVHGDALVVMTSQDAGTPSLSDSKGNSYAPISTSDAECAVYYVGNIPAGSNTITMSITGATYYSLAVEEIAGGVNAVDSSATQSQTGTTLNTPTLTTTRNNEFVVSGVCNGSGGNAIQSAQLSSPWSGRVIAGQHVGGEMVSDRFGATSGNYSNSFTYGSSITASTVILGLYNGSAGVQPSVGIITENIKTPFPMIGQ